MDKDSYKNKKVLIFGLGINQGGVGSAKFFANNDAILRVTDLKTAEQLQTSIDQLKEYPNIEYILGQHRYEDFDWADLIIKNPGVKPDNVYIKYAKTQGKEIEMDMGIFLEYVSTDRIIGITGTKGKSTTASLIYEILKKSGKDVLFAGNIGKSVLDTLEKVGESTIVVLELSSFQLDAFRKHQVSPKWAVITNIQPDHLNYYHSMEDYIKAKRDIALYQKSEDFLFINKGDLIADDQKFLTGFKAKVNYYSAENLPSTLKTNLVGLHNLENIAAALAVAKQFGIDQEKSLPILADFQGVEFRMQLVKDTQGIKIYNDTAATNPQAASASLQSLPNSILIAGGTNKKLPYQDFAQTIAKCAKEVYYLEGDATEEIKNFKFKIKNLAEKDRGTYTDFTHILEKIKPTLKEGDIILLSPGAASFNLFQNEFDRGRKFNQAVEKVFK